LRCLTIGGDALHSRAGRDLTLETGGSREGQEDARRYARPRPITDEPCQFHYGQPLGSGSQVAFVGDPFLVEAEYIRHNGPGVEQRNRGVARLPRGELLERIEGGG